MRAEFQGEGTYTYECDDPYCYFCDRLGLKPPAPKEERPFVFILPAAPVQEDILPVIKKDPYFTLSNYQRKKLRDLEYARPTVKPSFMKQDHTY